jgi:hypothetical protein
MAADHGTVGKVYEECVSAMLFNTPENTNGESIGSVANLAEMTAVGLDLPAGTLRDAGKYGYRFALIPAPYVTYRLFFSPHILAPTASDLVKYGKQDTILAGFHSDLNFLTIHGRSRYPGLHIWARNTGKRIPVKIPEGNYLLVQAGKQLEHLSGGLIKAGFHEVVVNERTLAVRFSTILPKFPCLTG